MILTASTLLVFFLTCLTTAAIATLLAFKPNKKNKANIVKPVVPFSTEQPIAHNYRNRKYRPTKTLGFSLSYGRYGYKNEACDSSRYKPHLTPSTDYSKEMFDRTLAVVSLLALAPVLLTLAIGIKLSSQGPILSKQARRGACGREIQVYKFRSVYLCSHYKSTEPDQRQKFGITPLGIIMRRYALDELPQLINILSGEMSFVGPRAHIVGKDKIYARKIEDYTARYLVKPGITGLAQVYYQGEIGKFKHAEREIQLDLRYVQQHNIWLDSKILICRMIPSFKRKLLRL